MTHLIGKADPTLERLTRLVNGEVVEPKGLEEVLVGHPMEDWARLEAARLGVDLSLTLPLGLVMTSAMSHGSVRMSLPGYPEPTAITVQFIGLADSGVGKTTVLRAGRGVMREGLDAGEDAMRQWSAVMVADAVNQVGVTPAEWEAVYRAGICPGGTLVGSATPEALRNSFAENGSHQVVWTAESDFLDEIGRYSKDGGSVSMMLHGWDAEDIATLRTKEKVIRADGASLPMALLIQPDTFEEITASPVFVTKGVLHRTLILSSGAVDPGVDAIEEIDANGLAVLSGPLEAARLAFGHNLAALSVDTAPRRASVAAMAFWRANRTMTTVPRPTVLPMRHMRLADDAARAEYARIQEFRKECRRAAVAQTNPGSGMGGSLWEPLCSRLTDHVCRCACNYRLAADPMSTVITAADLRDAMDRVIPWTWEHWAVSMARRNTVSMEAAVAKSIRENPRGIEVNIEGFVLRAMGMLCRDSGVDLLKMSNDVAKKLGPGPSFTKSEVAKKAQHMLPRAIRAGAYRDVVKTVNEMVAVGEFVEDAVGEGYNGHGRVRLTVSGMTKAAVQVR